MYEPNIRKQFLGSIRKEFKLYSLVSDLYQILVEFTKHPKVKTEMIFLIDAYINDDDLSEKPFEDIPF